MLTTLATLHSVDIEAVGLSDYGAYRSAASLQHNKAADSTATASASPAFTPYVLRQVKTWSKQFKASETETIADMDFLMAELASCLPSNAELRSSLVHGDYKIDNLIFRMDSSEVATILDWELSALGDPIADVAYNFMVYFIPPKNKFLLGFKDDLPPGIPSISEALEIYRQKRMELSTGDTFFVPPSMSDLEYYLAFSFFRVSAILQGVYKRSILGNASAANASAALEFAKITAGIGAELLRKHQRGRGRTEVGASFQNNTRRNYSSQRSIPVAFQPLISPRAQELLLRSEGFLKSKLLPVENEILSHMNSSPDRWKTVHSSLERVKSEAKKEGLWNLFMPVETDKGKYGAGLTNLEYASIAELTGYMSPLAPEVLNCNAPDTGNMEVLARYGTEEQRSMWLSPLLEGATRSCFAMTEPEVASSDATNMYIFI